MAYTDNPSTKNSDAIRLMVGDISTSTSREFLSDKAYTYFFAQSSNNVFLAAQLACQSLGSLFASTAVEKKVGDLLVRKNPDMAASYLRLGKAFGAQALATVSPSAGGISKSDKRNAERDMDRAQPAFIRKIMDNYLALDAVHSAPSSTGRYW